MISQHLTEFALVDEATWDDLALLFGLLGPVFCWACRSHICSVRAGMKRKVKRFNVACFGLEKLVENNGPWLLVRGG